MLNYLPNLGLSVDTSTWIWPIKIGVVLGLMILGALIAGVLVQLVSRLLARAKAPGPVLKLSRIGGGIAGLLIALAYLEGTGGGTGWFGGGRGGKDGKTDGVAQTAYSSSEAAPPPAKPDEKEIQKANGNNEITELRVEILSFNVLSKDDIAKSRFFRVTTPNGPEQKSLKEVVQYITELKDKPAFVKLIDYSDSADTDNAKAIDKLRELARSLKKNPDKWIQSESMTRPSPRP